MSKLTYPDHVAAKLPAGWRAKLEALAKRDHRRLGPYLRDVLRKHLQATDRADRRKRAAK